MRYDACSSTKELACLTDTANMRLHWPPSMLYSYSTKRCNPWHQSIAVSTQLSALSFPLDAHLPLSAHIAPDSTFPAQRSHAPAGAAP